MNLLKEVLKVRRRYQQEVGSISSLFLREQKYKESIKILMLEYKNLTHTELELENLKKKLIISKLKRNNQITLIMMKSKNKLSKNCDNLKKKIINIFKKIETSLRKDVYDKINNNDELMKIKLITQKSESNLKRKLLHWKTEELLKLRTIRMDTLKVIEAINKIETYIEIKFHEKSKLDSLLLATEEQRELNEHNIYIGEHCISFMNELIKYREKYGHFSFSIALKNKKLDPEKEIMNFVNLSKIGGIKIDIGSAEELIKAAKKIERIKKHLGKVLNNSRDKINKIEEEQYVLRKECRTEYEIVKAEIRDKLFLKNKELSKLSNILLVEQ